MKLSLPELHYKNKLFFMGSCFSDNMAYKLNQDKIDIVSNPFGVMFHPEAIAKVLERSLKSTMYNEQDFFKWDGYWFCYEHNSKLSEQDLQAYIGKANKLLIETKKQLQKTDTLFITFGSGWGYEREGSVVANCHKQKEGIFDKKLLNLKFCSDQLLAIIKDLKILNKGLNIVFTVSPVRHLKDGFIENQRSKSLLNTLCHQLCESSDKLYYFPSYEYVIDYLRDHSFFKTDQVHPNEQAVSKLYDFFLKHFFDASSNEVISQWQSLKLSLDHSSLRKYSPSNLTFKENLKVKLELFASSQEIDCGNEIKSLINEISEIRQAI